MSKFIIDFFEFAFLVEACIPPRPIARSMFFDSVSEKYYDEMTSGERNQLYTWMSRIFTDDDIKEVQVIHFLARFNPENQYKVTAQSPDMDTIGTFECYLYDNEYHTSMTTSIIESYIIEIKRMSGVS